MVICKFFLQGNCKFGNYCKNEHQINDDFSQTPQNASILRQSHFGNQFQPQNAISKDKSPGSTVDINTLVKSVVTDMTLAEKSGQWFLSCYAPFKDKPVFPGFEDHSFEEIRLGYYEARNNGSMEQYKQQLNLTLQQALVRLKSLQNPSVDIVNMLKNLYNSPVSNQVNPLSGTNVFNSNTTSSTVFGQNAPFSNQGSSIFAQANQNIFGKPQEQSNTGGSIFGGANNTNNLFGNQKSIFGTNQTQTTSSNIFSQSNPNVMQNSNSIFGGQPTMNAPVQSSSIFGSGCNSTNTFGGSSPTNAFVGSSPTNTFGGSNPTNVFSASNPTNTFTASNNMFLGNQTPNVFGQSPQSTQSSSIFGSQNTTVLQQPNLFTTSPTQSAIPPSNIFGMDSAQNPPQSVFGAQPSTLFATQQSPPVSHAQSTNLFGLQNPMNLQQSPSPNVFGSAPNVQPNLPQPQQIFGAPVIQPVPQQNPMNIFGSPTTRDVNSPIFQQNISNSPFIKNSSEVQSHSSNIFGGQTFNPLTQSQKEPIEEEIYSKLGGLTEQELKWFQSDDLIDLNIPENPPAYEMCFKA